MAAHSDPPGLVIGSTLAGCVAHALCGYRRVVTDAHLEFPVAFQRSACDPSTA